MPNGYRGPQFTAPVRTTSLQNSINLNPPSIGETAMAALRQENLLGSLFQRGLKVTNLFDGPRQDGYSPISRKIGTKYEPFIDQYAGVINEEEEAQIDALIDQQLQDRETLAAAGGLGFGLAMLAAIADPTTFIPIGGQAAKGVRGANFIRRAMRGSGQGMAAAGGSTLVQELGLMATQETRTFEEVLANTAGATLLGGFLGGGIGALSRAEIKSTADLLKRDLETINQAAAGESRTQFRDFWIEATSADPEQVDGILALLEAGPIARWARDRGKGPEEFWSETVRGLYLVEDADVFVPDEFLQRLIDASGGLDKNGQPRFRANVQFLPEDGRALMTAVKGSANIDSLLHEVVHIYRRYLPEDDLADLSLAYGVQPGKWDARAEERFVADVEYIIAHNRFREGTNEGLKKILIQVRDWLVGIYQATKGSTVREQIHPDVKRVIEDHFLPGEKPLKVSDAADASRPLVQEGGNQALSVEEEPFFQGGTGPKSLFQTAVQEQTETPAFKRWFGNSKVVDDSGKPLVVYHGSDEAGFTEFISDIKHSGREGIFFTGRLETANTYHTGRPYSTIDFPKPVKNISDIKAFAEIEEVYYVEADGSGNVTQYPYPELYDTVEDLKENWDLDSDTEIKSAYRLYDVDGDIATEDIERNVIEYFNENRGDFIEDKQGAYEVYLSMEEPLVIDADGNAWNDVYGETEGGQGTTTNEIASDARGQGYDGVIFKNIFDDGGGGGFSGETDVYVVFDSTQIKSSNANEGTFDPENPNILFQGLEEPPYLYKTEEVEIPLDEIFEKTGGMPTGKDLAQHPFAPAPRKGRSKKLNRNVTVTGFDELLEWTREGIKKYGSHGLNWYNEVGRGIYEHVGKDMNRFMEAVVILGVTSAQKAVSVNVAETYAIMRWIRTRSDFEYRRIQRIGSMDKSRAVGQDADPNIEAQLTVLRESILRTNGSKLGISNDQLFGILKFYVTGGFDGGLKVTTFMTQVLMRGQGKFDPRSVMDVHMARVFGWRFLKEETVSEINPKTGRKVKKKTEVDDAVITGEKQYRYAQYLTAKVAQRLGIQSDQAQALLWLYAKDNLSPKKDRSRAKHLKDHPEIPEGTWADAKLFVELEGELQRMQDAIGKESMPFEIPEDARVQYDGGTVRYPYTNDYRRIQDIEDQIAAASPQGRVSTTPGEASGFSYPKSTKLQDLRQFHEDVLHRLLDDFGHLPLLRDLGITHQVLTNRPGSYQRVEPGFEIRLINATAKMNRQVAALLGHLFGQDAAVSIKADPSGGFPGLLLKNSEGFTDTELEEIYQAVNPRRRPNGINFSVTDDGLLFLFIPEARMKQAELDQAAERWFNHVQSKIAKVRKGSEFDFFKQASELISRNRYGGILKKSGYATGAGRSPSVLERGYREIWRAYIAEFERRRGLGWKFNLRKFAKESGLNQKEFKQLQSIYDEAREEARLISHTDNRGLGETRSTDEEPSILFQTDEKTYMEGLQNFYKEVTRVPDNADPNKIAFPKWMPQWLRKGLAKMHPGMRPLVLETLNKPAEIVGRLLNTPEILNKNLRGIKSVVSAEAERNSEINRMQQAFGTAFLGGYDKRLKRVHQEQTGIEDVNRLRILRARILESGDVESYKKSVGHALMYLEENSDLSAAKPDRFDPEVWAAAKAIGRIMNETGQRLAKAGMLDESMKELLDQGFMRFSRVWNHGAIEEYREVLRQLMREKALDIPEDELDASIDDTIARIMNSPTGHIGVEIEADDITKVDKARFLKSRVIEIDTRDLVDVVVRDAQGQPVKNADGSVRTVSFVETDPEAIFNAYINSVIPDLVLTQRFGDITMAKAFEEIDEEVQQKLEALRAKGANQKTINKVYAERDAAFADLKAIRDIFRNDYRPSPSQKDPQGFAYRFSSSLLTVNAMSMLGGVTLSSVGDVARPLFFRGASPYARDLQNYFRYMNTPEMKKFKNEALHVWGVAGDLFNSSRYGMIADLNKEFSPETFAERVVKFSGDNMGLLTGMDWWNGNLKTLSAFVVNHAVMEAAQKIQKAVDAGTIAKTFEGAKSVVKESELVTLLNMGIDVDDLYGFADEVFTKQRGEVYDGMILPRIDKWENQALRDTFRGAITREVDNLIVTPGIGDKPLWTRYQLGQHISQFKSYPLAAMRRIVFRGIQQPSTEFATGVFGAIVMGGFVYTTKMLERGQTPTGDPRQFLFESIDRSGVMGYMLDINTMMGRLTGGVNFTGMLGLTESTRYRARSIIDTVGGPSMGTLDDYFRMMTDTAPDALTGQLGKDDFARVNRLIWYSKVPFVRSSMEFLKQAASEE